MMANECDVFSDSYGCIITKSIGYQSPFPIVRLSNGQASSHVSGATLQGACFASSLAEQQASRARLLTFDFSAQDPCVSLLQLLDKSRKPLELDQKTEFVQKIEMSEAASAVVARSEGARWCTSLYINKHGSDTQTCRACVQFCNTVAGSLRDGALWLVAAASTKEGGAARQLHRYTMDSALSGAVSSAVTVDELLLRPLDVVALTADTAVVFGTGGFVVVDSRHVAAPVPVHAVATAPIANGGVAGEDKIVTFGEDYALRVFDTRSTSAPLMEATTSSYVCVKTVVGCRAALLVTGDTTGVFDLQTLATVASLQHSGDTVLDAALLPHHHGGVRICTSTESGMLYDWTVAM